MESMDLLEKLEHLNRKALEGGGPAELWLLRARCARALGQLEEARGTLERLLAREDVIPPVPGGGEEEEEY